jgi:hypothetical protein
VVGVAVGVVLGEDSKSLVVLVLSHQETRRLGHPVDEGDLNERREGLEKSRNSPRPLVVSVVGTKGDPGDDCSQSQSLSATVRTCREF